MDNARTLRRKAARFFENAASSATAKEAEKLNEVGRQLALWADDLEEINDAHKPKALSRGNESQRRTVSYRVTQREIEQMGGDLGLMAPVRDR
jgi:hypothetical protein